uniref:Putative uncharacterized protein encoded by LINC00575 n=1 Tax=Homo sapiens TaxID=9606 RepID=CD011_HUMAN|nr:RecName: Full=Putative uncharacterized protein encoded by LINC00575 [Homo sapiens]AAR08267.1 hypothetical C4orf11 protein [Homo sapiens]AAR08268.1 hypothetical C4orf11 protein variant 2 [Homo sapiens]
MPTSETSWWPGACLCSSCAWTSDSRFFNLWTLGLAPAASQGFSGLKPQTDDCTVSFPGFEAFGLGLSHYWHLSFPACRQSIMGLCLVIVLANSS